MWRTQPWPPAATLDLVRAERLTRDYGQGDNSLGKRLIPHMRETWFRKINCAADYANTGLCPRFEFSSFS